jgi:hypothetical protein
MAVGIPPFLSSLLNVANKVRAAKNIEPSQNIIDAVALVATDLLATTIPPKSFSKVAIAPELSNSIGAMLCFVVSSIVIRAGKDGHEIPKNDALATAFLSLYRMHDRQTIVRLMAEGVRYYWSLLDSARADKKVQEHLYELDQAVVLYAMTGDESLKDQVSYLYAVMVQGQSDQK